MNKNEKEKKFSKMANSDEGSQAETQKDQEKFPPPDQLYQSLTQVRAMFGQFTSSPLDKFESPQISQALDNMDKSDERHFKAHIFERKIMFTAFLIIIALVIFLTIYLSKSDKDLFITLLTIIFSFAGGFGAGFGIARTRK